MAYKWVAELPKPNGAWTVSAGEIAEFAALVDAAEAARGMAAPGAAATDTARARGAFAALVRKMRFLRGRKFFSPPMAGSDYTRLGLKPPDTVRTEHAVVNELVEFELRLRAVREIVVNFWIKGAEHRAKPARCVGAVLVYGTPDTPPEHPDDLARHILASRTPRIIRFEETLRGKTVYIALCWQNERGIRGPWSEIKTAIIP
jgi:hypothetical protein